jgi:hypothetical protein
MAQMAFTARWVMSKQWLMANCVVMIAQTFTRKTNDTRMPRNNPRVAHSDASISSLINSL